MQVAFVPLLLAVFLAAACKADTNADAPEPAAASQAPSSLAELDIPNGTTPLDGLLVGGQPTDDQLEQARALGVKTVINTRTEAEKEDYATEAAKAEALGMTYVHIPVDAVTGEGLTEESARKLADALGEGGTPAILHCGGGARAASLLALKAAYVDGLSTDEALALAQSAGISSDAILGRLRTLLSR